jgi:hypothetical protein
VNVNASTPPVALEPPETGFTDVQPVPSCGIAESGLHSTTTRKFSLFLKVPAGADTVTVEPSFRPVCGLTVSGLDAVSLGSAA